MLRITKYVWADILQNRVVLAYTAFLLAVSFALFSMDSNPAKGLMSLLNIVLMVVPLISIIFTTIHFYNSYEFIELLLAQPIRRSHLLLSEYAGVASSLTSAFLIGVGLPVAIFAGTATGLFLVGAGVSLTLIFVSVAFWASVFTRDKAKGIGVTLLLWFYFVLLYDGLVLTVLFSFSDYPLEKVMLVLTTLNPVDLARIVVLLQMDVSALMGYTGALYAELLGSTFGIVYACLILLVWAVVPLLSALYMFRRKDL
ncbi:MULTISPECIES: ABC transporter permease subunit [unclassified Spirosoma]|uniref:ABC transporter permease subunit n=1 Tax=unclassified Spirosoma TaxID=2621999 RepID=UPI000965A756|nr:MULTISPECIES: ABC transporter permease subunit [unclassified Spirosoma]MBN8820441.1 ABC transporter permease subunit [Spirosoma sp.]OJW70022.1 MAG: ABC transporter permease [Spirosoma sp. 48-14]